MPSIHIEIRGQSFDANLPATAVRVGKAEDADLRIDGEGIGAWHCLLEPLDAGLHKLSDARSGQPTKVNGIAIRQVSLRDGDVIEIGEARIVYRAAAVQPIPVPAAAATPALPARPAPAPRSARNGNGRAGARRNGNGNGIARSGPAQTEGAPAATSPATAEAERDAPTPLAAPSPANGNGLGERKARAGGERRGRLGAVLGLAAALAVLVVIVLAVGDFGGSGGGQADARRAYEEGMRHYENKDYATARRVWSHLASGDRTDAVARDAANGLQLIGDVEREIETKLDRLWAERLDLTADVLAAARANFVTTYGERQATTQFDTTSTRIRGAQAQWKKEELERVQEDLRLCVSGHDFVGAQEAWRRLGRSAPAAVEVRTEVDEGLAALQGTAETSADGLLERSREWIAGRQAWRSVQLLEDVLPRFKGMAAQRRIAAGLEEARVAAARPDAGTPGTPGTDPAAAEPGTPSTPPTPAEGELLAARAREALAQAEVEAEARRFGVAASLLRPFLENLPEGSLRVQVAGRHEDLERAEAGLVRLIEHINADPRSYAGVRLAPGLSLSIVEADREFLSATVRGGQSKHRWARIPAKGFARLVARMRPAKEDALPAAALLHAVGLVEESERALYQAGEKGVDTSVLFPVLARWRGEETPEGGYVAHEGLYVTPERREFLLREARIEAALKRMLHREAQERAAAYAELLDVGEPARERFQSALGRQRAYRVDQLVASRSFTSGKYKAKLLQLLDERRQHALALIYDAQAYPYPNPAKKNQKEVEERVDRVREVWERPFDLVAQWDKKLGEHLALVTELDEVLAKVDAAYRPDLDGIKERINKAIDVPSSADPNRRPYSLKVLGYNETLTTSATHQEKDNVRVVNDYRMMMGLFAVKINERLVRAARGHSRHMQQNNYFAHNVPQPYAKPENASPGARAKRQGYGGGVGENIARGPGTGRGAFLAWFGSSGHHRNMLGRGWLEMGCGQAGGTWWTQLFGGGSKSLKKPDPLPDPEPAFAPDPESTEKDRPVPRGPVEVPDEVPPGEDEMPPEDDAPSPEDDAPPPPDGR